MLNLKPSFLRHKKKNQTFILSLPATWTTTCDCCGYMFWRTSIEGNNFPLGCPMCGNIQHDG